MSNTYYSIRYPRTGIILYALTPVLFIAAFYLIAYARAMDSFMYAVLSILLCLASGLVFRYARRSLTRVVNNIESLLQHAHDKNVMLILFLRDFYTEGQHSTDNDDNDISGMFFVSEEDKLASAVKDYGLLLTIGKPGEKLPTSGAYRLYVDDKDWKSIVNELLRQSDIILLRCGATESLSWELEQIQNNDKLSQTIFLPQTSDKDKTLKTYSKIKQLVGTVSVDSLDSLSIIDDINLDSLEDEDMKQKAMQTLQHARQNMLDLSAMQQSLDYIGIMMPRLFIMENGHPIPFTGKIYEAVQAVFDHLGLVPRTSILTTLKYIAIMLIVFSPLLLFGSSEFCGWLDMQQCVSFFESYGVKIFLGLVIVLLVIMVLII